MLYARKKRRGVGIMAAQHQHAIAILRKAMMVLLPVWLVYFFAVTFFAKSLNAIKVPVVDMPLSTYLVIQGSLVAFAIILVLLTRAYAATSRT